jgi:hypothetical protein
VLKRLDRQLVVVLSLSGFSVLFYLIHYAVFQDLRNIFSYMLMNIQLLWAVSHLTEELAYRPDLRGLPEADYAHLSWDIARAYVPLLSEWLAYALHLRNSYPYLFSLVARLNPFDPSASVVIRS